MSDSTGHHRMIRTRACPYPCNHGRIAPTHWKTECKVRFFTSLLTPRVASVPRSRQITIAVRTLTQAQVLAAAFVSSPIGKNISCLASMVNSQTIWSVRCWCVATGPAFSVEQALPHSCVLTQHVPSASPSTHRTAVLKKAVCILFSLQGKPLMMYSTSPMSSISSA